MIYFVLFSLFKLNSTSLLSNRVGKKSIIRFSNLSSLSETRFQLDLRVGHFLVRQLTVNTSVCSRRTSFRAGPSQYFSRSLFDSRKELIDLLASEVTDAVRPQRLKSLFMYPLTSNQSYPVIFLAASLWTRKLLFKRPQQEGCK